MPISFIANFLHLQSFCAKLSTTGMAFRPRLWTPVKPGVSFGKDLLQPLHGFFLPLQGVFLRTMNVQGFDPVHLEREYHVVEGGLWLPPKSRLGTRDRRVFMSIYGAGDNLGRRKGRGFYVCSLLHSTFFALLFFPSFTSIFRLAEEIERLGGGKRNRERGGEGRVENQQAVLAKDSWKKKKISATEWKTPKRASPRPRLL